MVAVAVALPTQDQEVVTWTTGLLGARQRFELPERLDVRWRMERTLVPDPAALAAVRERVKDRPEHPDRLRLESIERRRAGREYFDRRLLVGPGGAARVCRSNGTAPAEYFDTVLDSERLWSLSPLQLTLSKPGGAGWENAAALVADRAELLVLLTGGLSELGNLDLTPDQSEVSGDAWRVRWLAASRGATAQAKGRWGRDPSARTVEELNVEIGSGPDAIRVSWRSEGWSVLPSLGLPAAARVHEVTRPGWDDRLFTLTSADLLDITTVSAALKPPAIDGADPIRGPVTFTSVTDSTGSEPIFSTRDADGTFRITPRSATPSGQREASLRTWGWVLMAMFAAAFIVLRVRRAGSPTP